MEEGDPMALDVHAGFIQQLPRAGAAQSDCGKLTRNWNWNRNRMIRCTITIIYYLFFFYIYFFSAKTISK